jgi:hypothetical protein
MRDRFRRRTDPSEALWRIRVSGVRYAVSSDEEQVDTTCKSSGFNRCKGAKEK